MRLLLVALCCSSAALFRAACGQSLTLSEPPEKLFNQCNLPNGDRSCDVQVVAGRYPPCFVEQCMSSTNLDDRRFVRALVWSNEFNAQYTGAERWLVQIQVTYNDWCENSENNDLADGVCPIQKCEVHANCTQDQYCDCAPSLPSLGLEGDQLCTKLPSTHTRVRDNSEGGGCGSQVPFRGDVLMSQCGDPGGGVGECMTTNAQTADERMMLRTLWVSQTDDMQQFYADKSEYDEWCASNENLADGVCPLTGCQTHDECGSEQYCACFSAVMLPASLINDTDWSTVCADLPNPNHRRDARCGSSPLPVVDVLHALATTQSTSRESLATDLQALATSQRNQSTSLTALATDLQALATSQALAQSSALALSSNQRNQSTALASVARAVATVNERVQGLAQSEEDHRPLLWSAAAAAGAAAVGVVAAATALSCRRPRPPAASPLATDMRNGLLGKMA